MTKKFEEIILEELFKLSDKVDKMQEKMSKLATKEELREEVSKLATKKELKEEISKVVSKKEFEEAMEKQAFEIAEIFHDSFRTTTKYINKKLG